MIIRGGGATDGEGVTGDAACICVTFAGAEDACDAGVPMVGAAGVAIRGAVIDGAPDDTEDPAAGVVAAGGVTGALGGITTTDGGRYVAATEAGVTILGAGGAEISLVDFGGMAFGGAAADRGSVFPSAFASAACAVAGGFAAGRAAGGSGVPFCWVMARSTSPGREMCERSILVLISSSPWAAREEDFAPLGAASERPRRCLRTKSASWSSRELECVFFSATPTEVRASRISLLLTSNSRARSLIRILLIRCRFLFLPHVSSL
jgi:hypothetical protein